jgi:hypothetical protein
MAEPGRCREAGEVEGDQRGKGDIDIGPIRLERPRRRWFRHAPDRPVADDDGDVGSVENRGQGLMAGGPQRVELGRGAAGQLGYEQGRVRQDGGRDRMMGSDRLC